MHDIVATYCAAWNEPDRGARDRLLAASVTDDVVYTDPETRMVGATGLSAHIAAFRAAYPDHVLELAGGVDAHHDVLRFAWSVRRPDGTALSSGLDVCRVSTDGRLATVTGFFGPLPTAP